MSIENDIDKLPPYTEKAVKKLILELYRFQNTAWEGVDDDPLSSAPFDSVWIKADILLTQSLELLGFAGVEEASA
jgi:hypothetical protein